MNDTKKDLTMTREFDARRELVWRAWTDPELLKEWWGPNGVTNPTCEWEARPGGKIHIVMLAGAELGPMAGQEWPMTGEIKEVDKPSRLVFTANALQDGRAILEHITTVTLEEEGNKTKMTVRVRVTMTTPEATGPLAGMEQGWNQQLDKLVTFIEKL
jgi:uncharacterized protein YndB with AHSA1/START domain